MGRRLMPARLDTQPIAGAANRLQRVATERLVDLAPQPAHVDVDDVGAVLVGEVPRVLEQVEAGQNLAGPAHEGLEQGELLRGERDRLRGARHLTRCRVEP